MSRKEDEAVLQAIGQITVRTDFDNPQELQKILQTVSRSEGFRSSAYGKAFIEKIKKKLNNPNSASSLGMEQALKRSENRMVGLFRDMDESLLQMASQRTLRNMEKTVWGVLALSVVDTIAIFFIAYFLWRLNT